MLPDIQETYIVETPEQALALLNPLRAEMLSHLAQPASAAEIARTIGETPQRMNYHLKALEKVGLVRKAGTRQVRNLVEVLYQAVAKTFILSDSLNLHPDTVQQMKDHGSLAHLITIAERIKRDSLLLMEKSDASENVPSASLHTKVRLANEAQRSAFVQEYVELVKQLAGKYGKDGDASETYSVVLAVYPEPERTAGPEQPARPVRDSNEKVREDGE